MSEEISLTEKRDQLVQFILDHKQLLVWFILIGIIYTSIDIRLTNLGNLKDVTNGKYIAADLDAFLFYRYGEYILEQGTHMTFDPKRYVPFGQPWEWLKNLYGFPYFLVWLYKFAHFFNSTITYDYIYIIYPVIVLGVTLLVFFLLVKTVFGSLAALLATAALGYSPAYIFRTTAGVADHDAVGMLAFTLALYVYMLALKQATPGKSAFFGFLTGLTTVGMVLVWPGAGNFLYLILGTTIFAQIFLNVFHQKDYYAYTAWFLTFTSILAWLNLLPLDQLIGSVTTEVALGAFGTATIYYFLFEKDIFAQAARLKATLPSGIISILCIVLVGFLVLSVAEGPLFLVHKATGLYDDLVKPWGKNRWQLTVAEQHQPYIVDWYGQLGKYYVLFFLVGSIYLFYELVKPLALKKLKNPYLSTVGLVLFYTAFIFSFTYSRYAANSVLNGTSQLSIYLYIGSLIIFVLGFLLFYLYMYYQDREGFYATVSQLNSIYVLIFIWFFFLVIGARGAIRLLFTFAPVTCLLFGYFTTRLYEIAQTIKEKYYSIPLVVLLLLFVLSPVVLGKMGKGILFQYYDSTKSQVQYTGSPYTMQWQVAMDWVRKNTPEDAVFAHWWDYGYWVQTGGKRATVTDGGNEHGYWNYQIARHVLTGQSETEALEVLAAHNASYLLIVSDEIGKYTAFSSIGGDEKYDRYSWINPFTLNQQQTQETRNSTIYLYQGSYPLDDDFMYKGQFFPQMAAVIGGFFVPVGEATIQEGNTTRKELMILQPHAALFTNNGQRFDIPLECIFMNGNFIRFPEPGLKGCLKIIPNIQGQQQNPIGAALYVSEEGMRALWTNLYLFDNKNSLFPASAFELAYDDHGNWPFLIYNGRLIGPHRIWKVNYPKDFVLNEEKRALYVGFEHENPAAQRV